MKKQLLSIFTLIAFSSAVFASDVWLYGQNKDPSCAISQNGSVVTESVTGDNGERITLSAELKNSNVNYNLYINGASNLGFVNYSNFISVYTGNYDTDSWNYVDYKMDTVSVPQASVPNATSSNSTDDTLENCAEVCIAGVTVCLCSVAIVSMCDNLEGGDHDGPPPPHHGPDVVIDPYIGVGNSSNTYQSNNQLYNYSGVSGDYICAFHSSASNGPDYKVKILTNSKEYCFYFLRSDRNSVTANPFRSSKKTHHSIVATVNVPELDTFGGMYIYGGSTVGVYAGLEVYPGLNITDPNIVGTITDTDWSTLNYTDEADPDTYRKFVQDGNELTDEINFNLGLTLKLNDYLWLLGGVKLGVVDSLLSGNVYTRTDSETEYTKGEFGYVENSYMTIMPQVGLNAVLGYLNVGCLVNYWPTKGVSCDVLFGLAF